MNFLFSKRFMPLFITQYLGAFNDNFLKNAILIMATFQLCKDSTQAGFIANFAAGCFILPYVLFSSLAGQVADKFDKAQVAKVVKLVEIILMIGAAIGFYFASIPVLLTMLFLMGAQSTFFGPVKYSLLPIHLQSNELLKGNAVIGGGTYLAILTGVIAGGITVSIKNGIYYSGGVLFLLAVIGFIASLKIPAAPALDKDVKISWNLGKEIFNIIKNDIVQQKYVFCCVLSASMFWLAGSILVTQLPLYTRDVLGGDEFVCTLFFALFSIGVGIGALLSTILHKGKTCCSKYVVMAIIFMAIGVAFLAGISFIADKQTIVLPLAKLYTNFLFIISVVAVLVIAICGGLWSVPIQALMQKSSKKKVLARVIAGNNIFGSFYMVMGAVISGLILKLNLTIGSVFIFTAISILIGLLNIRVFFRKKKQN
jgi:acyl-[acyl-carrier-protein]-phospholipid O-acyltransferase/long-chain-fatty-acid--[acyl-carrier-protein] ligase